MILHNLPKVLATFILLIYQNRQVYSNDYKEENLKKIESEIFNCKDYECAKAFNDLEKLIRNNDSSKYDYREHKIFLKRNKERLKKDINEIIAAIEKATEKALEKGNSLELPLNRVRRHDIGIGGFIAKGYDWFEGNYYKGHPAYDVFVHDKNQDCLDDKTKRPLEVYAAANSIVLSIYSEWKPGSSIRGGNYVYLYNPERRLLFYYAHLDKIFVNVEDFVKKGQLIAYLGRTGRYAFEKRSPTHLHFSVFRYDENKKNFIPIDWLASKLFKIK